MLAYAITALFTCRDLFGFDMFLYKVTVDKRAGYRAFNEVWRKKTLIRLNVCLRWSMLSLFVHIKNCFCAMLVKLRIFSNIYCALLLFEIWRDLTSMVPGWRCCFKGLCVLFVSFKVTMASIFYLWHHILFKCHNFGRKLLSAKAAFWCSLFFVWPCCCSLRGVLSSRKHTYKILTPLNPTFIQ